MTNESRAPEYIESEHSQPGSKPAGPPTGDTTPAVRESSSSQGQSGSAGPDGSAPPYSSDRAASKTPPKTTASVTDDDDESVKRGDPDHR